MGPVEPVEFAYEGDGPIVLVGGTNDPATPIRWAQKMLGELGPNARLVTSTAEGHGQFLTSDCVTEIEAAVLADLTLPEPDTVCNPDPAVDKPEWWDALPVPDDVSPVVELPNLLAALGAEPSVVFSEMRTTTMSSDEAIAAYTEALGDEGIEEFESPDTQPIDDMKQGTYTDGGDRTMIVIAFGPKSFEDEELKAFKKDVPPDTTLVWLVAVDL